MLGDPQEAEDAVQQTFLAAYSDLISTDKPIHLRPWLFTIARNRCYTLLRGRREQPTSELEEPVTEGLASQVQRREDLRELVVDLRRLPDEQRAALVLAELDSLSHEEIAIALGVPGRRSRRSSSRRASRSLPAAQRVRPTAPTSVSSSPRSGVGRCAAGTCAATCGNARAAGTSVGRSSISVGSSPRCSRSFRPWPSRRVCSAGRSAVAPPRASAPAA